MHQLLQRSADVNLQDSYGATALMHAVQEQRATMVQALLRAGASRGQPDSDGGTPLEVAMGWGNQRIARLLRLGPDAGALDALDGIVAAS